MLIRFALSYFIIALITLLLFLIYKSPESLFFSMIFLIGGYIMIYTESRLK